MHGWLELAQPLVFVLTDGSGHTGRSRLDSTTQILTQAGATPGGIYGRLTDISLYAALLEHDFDLFIGLTEELSQALVSQEITYVVGDASEHYNPGHEVCRMLINAALKRVQHSTGRQIANFDFPLMGPPANCPEQLRHQAIFSRLDDAALERKLVAARNYAAIEADVNDALNGFSAEAFRVECLRPVVTEVAEIALLAEPPFYERYGEQQVAAGYYNRVLRYDEHVAPLAAALAAYLRELS